jgi:hypothetical protein
MSKNCSHEFTDIAPETSNEKDALIWEWCIRCGCLKLGEQIYSPGKHQKSTIVFDITDDSCVVCGKHKNNHTLVRHKFKAK